MDKLLQADGSQRSAGGAGWLDQTETALLVVAAVEETANLAKNLQRAGLSKDRAMISAYNNHGPWWNSESSHMNQAIKNAWFSRQGLISLLEQQRQFQC